MGMMDPKNEPTRRDGGPLAGLQATFAHLIPKETQKPADFQLVTLKSGPSVPILFQTDLSGNHEAFDYALRTYKFINESGDCIERPGQRRIVLSGDLCDRQSGIVPIAQRVTQLRDAGVTVSTTPGNHDLWMHAFLVNSVPTKEQIPQDVWEDVDGHFSHLNPHLAVHQEFLRWFLHGGKETLSELANWYRLETGFSDVASLKPVDELTEKLYRDSPVAFVDYTLSKEAVKREPLRSFLAQMLEEPFVRVGSLLFVHSIIPEDYLFHAGLAEFGAHMTGILKDPVGPWLLACGISISNPKRTDARYLIPEADMFWHKLKGNSESFDREPTDPIFTEEVAAKLKEEGIEYFVRGHDKPERFRDTRQTVMKRCGIGIINGDVNLEPLKGSQRSTATGHLYFDPFGPVYAHSWDHGSTV